MLLSDYLAALRRGWTIILAFLVIAILLSFVPRLTASPSYTTSTDLYVASNAKPDEVSTRVLTYVTAAGGDVMAGRVADELGGELDATVTAEALPGTLVIRLTATGSDAEQVREVAATYAEVLPDVIADLDELADPGSEPSRVQVVDAADLPVATEPSVLPGLVLATVLGLGAGLAVVVARETLRRERRDRRGEDL